MIYCAYCELKIEAIDFNDHLLEVHGVDTQDEPSEYELQFRRDAESAMEKYGLL